MLQDGRLHSGDHLLQIGDVNVRGMGSEQVASVLRQSGAHVRLIVARSVAEPTSNNPLHTPIVPTHQIDEHLHHINASLLASDNMDAAEYDRMMSAQGFCALVHQVGNANNLSQNETVFHFTKRFTMQFKADTICV